MWYPRRLLNEQYGEWFIIAWMGATGRVVAEAKKGRPFLDWTGLRDGLLDPTGEIHFEFGDTVEQAVAKLKSCLPGVQ